MSESTTIAIISALSAILGGLSAVVVQYFLAKAAESRANQKERNLEFRNRFEDCLVNLIEESDPDINVQPSISEITRNIIRLQLYLDLRNPLHKQLNGHLNRLGATIGGYADFEGKGLILESHSKIIDVGNEIIRETYDQYI